MSDPAKDGGCAFPSPIVCDNASNVRNAVNHGYAGMTLRDYFAAKAMQGQLANATILDRFGLTEDAVAKSSYQFADALLAARGAE